MALGPVIRIVPELTRNGVIMASGTLQKRELLTVTSDGVTKNLKIRTKNDKITDPNECPDFSEMIKLLPEGISLEVAGEKLVQRFQRRSMETMVNDFPLANGERAVLIPDPDDITMVMIGLKD